MEIWIKAYLSRSGWGNACRRKQLLHFYLAEDAVFAPPSLSSILLCFPHSFFLWFLFCFLHPGCILMFTFCLIGQSIIKDSAINSKIAMLVLHITVIWTETKYFLVTIKAVVSHTEKLNLSQRLVDQTAALTLAPVPALQTTCKRPLTVHQECLHSESISFDARNGIKVSFEICSR